MISIRSAALPGVLLCVLLLSPAAGAQKQPAMEPLDHAVCRLIEGAARANRLPVGFMTRIIWRESSFRPRVVSPAGAEALCNRIRSVGGVCVALRS